MSKLNIWLVIVFFLTACGSLAPVKPDMGEEPLTSAEEAAIIANEEEAWANRPKFDITIGDYEKAIAEFPIFAELEVIPNSPVYLTRNKLIELDYKTEGDEQMDSLYRIVIYINVHDKPLETTEEQLSQVLEMVIVSLNEEYDRELIFQRIKDNPLEIRQSESKLVETSYSDKVNLEVGHSPDWLNIWITPKETRTSP